MGIITSTNATELKEQLLQLDAMSQRKIKQLFTQRRQRDTTSTSINKGRPSIEELIGTTTGKRCQLSQPESLCNIGHLGQKKEE